METGNARSQDTTADVYFDVISPYAYLFFKHVEREPLPLALNLKPVVFAALLNSSGSMGPAEIPAKRRFTYQYCVWYGAHHGFPLVIPRAHPFNPIRYLRLCLAADCRPAAVQAIFDCIWTSGLDPASDAAWNLTCEKLAMADADALIGQQEIKDLLRHHTTQAVERGVFGVPTVVVGDSIFWGADALPMLRDYLAGAPVFTGDAMRGATTSRIGALR